MSKKHEHRLARNARDREYFWNDHGRASSVEQTGAGVRPDSGATARLKVADG